MDHGHDLEELDRHYTEALATHGDGPGAVQWSSVETQERRFEVLSQIVPSDVLRTASILDFGCGTGDLLRWLRTTKDHVGDYTGYDISDAMITTARERHADDPAARFERRNVARDGIDGEFDLVLVSGTFNNAVSDDAAFLRDFVRILHPHARIGTSFNALSAYVDYTTEGLAHRTPEDVFAFCKHELSPRVTLRHDYEIKDGVIPFEFTVYIYRSDLDPVAAVPIGTP